MSSKKNLEAQNAGVQDIPETYVCPISGALMVEPTIVVKTGKIYDKLSLKNLSDQNLQTAPLNDLKKVIQDYTKLYQNPKKNEEIKQECQEAAIPPQQEQNKDIYDNFQKFKQLSAEVKNLGSLVNNQDLKLYDMFDSLPYQIPNFQDDLDKLKEIRKKLQNIHCGFSSQQIWDLKTELTTCSQYLQQKLVDFSNETMMNIYENKCSFETVLNDLERKEIKLQDVYKEVQKEFTDTGVVQPFMYRFDFLSTQFRKPAINYYQLVQLFQSGDVSNRPVKLHMNQTYFDININSSVCVKGVRFHSTGSCLYLRLLLKNKDAKVSIEDCHFRGIGLCLQGVSDTEICGDVNINKINVKNALGCGIDIRYCNDVTAENAKISDCKHSGVQCRTSNQFLLRDFSIDNCGGNGGVKNYNMCSEVRNGTISNCKPYGVNVTGNGSVTGYNVTFTQNQNDFAGNFIRK